MIKQLRIAWRSYAAGPGAAAVLMLSSATAHAGGVGFGFHLGHGYYGSHHGISIGYGHRRHHGFRFGYRHHGHYYGHRSHRYGYGGHRGYGHHGYFPRHRYGQRYGYPYRYGRGYRYGYPYRYDRYGSYSRPTYSDDALPSSTAVRALNDDEGWRLLAEGKAIDAVSVFARLAEANRSDGELKAGYALAVAAAGDLDGGAWAMRRAFSIDPDSLHYVPVDGELGDVVDDLIARYEDTRDHSLAQQDAAFMTAAMYYLRHNNEAAGSALDEEDVSQSAVNLKRLLTENG